MVGQASCPEPRWLKELLDGALLPPEQTIVTGHLETCPNCQRALEALAADSEIWSGAARRLGQQAPTPESALQQAMAALKGEPAKPETQAEPSTQDDLSLDFLSAPEKPEQ